jgi:quinoprotein glucose dehydrogenase
LLAALPVAAQHGAPDGQWPHYGGDRGSTKFTALDQIKAANVEQLELAWSWNSVDADLPKATMAGHFKATPLMVDGRLYLTTPLQQAVALDAGDGKLIWRYDPKVYDVGRPTNTGFQHRGLEYWRSDTPEPLERLFFANGARQLISLDPQTGKPDAKFGDGGIVDTSQGLGREINPRMIAHNAPPIVCGDTVVLGSIIFDGPTRKAMPPGHVRGYDPRTGALRWVFHTIPQAGEPGVETWEEESWRYSGNTNVWTMMSCDEERGIVYLPTSTPTNDWYGGHRKGDNLYAESLVALDARSGEKIWHFQAVHHGVWDYDFPCAPNLVDIRRGDEVVPAVAQVSKQGFTYVFDRRDGTPIWPIEEREVPQSTVPGEQTSPTQPFPTKPPAFERQGITEDDIVDFTPELRAKALEILREYKWGPIFTPPVALVEGGKKGTLQVPSAAGGANWGGAAIDPRSATLFVPSMSLVMVNALDKPDAARSDFQYIRVGDWLPRGLDGIPFLKPPYGRITAIDLKAGEHTWMVAHGAGPKDHPLLAHLDLPDLGANAHGVMSNGGLVLTPELLFIIQGEWDPESMLRVGQGGYLRAFRTSDGAKVWERKLEKTPHGTPMSYLHEGRQYVAVAVGMGKDAELLAFGLPPER